MPHTRSPGTLPIAIALPLPFSLLLLMSAAVVNDPCVRFHFRARQLICQFGFFRHLTPARHPRQESPPKLIVLAIPQSMPSIHYRSYSCISREICKCSTSVKMSAPCLHLLLLARGLPGRVKNATCKREEFIAATTLGFFIDIS